MTAEELQILRLMMREEIGTAVSASEQRTGERLDQLDSRLSHMDGRIDQLDSRLSHMDGRIDQFAANQRSLHDSMLLLRMDVSGELEKMTVELRQAVSVLDETTKVINGMQADQRSLEIKVDETLLALKNEIYAFKQDTQHSIETFKLDTRHELQQDMQKFQQEALREFRHTAQLFQQEMRQDFQYDMGIFKQEIRQDFQRLSTKLDRFAAHFVEANGHTNERLNYHEDSPSGETHPRRTKPDSAA